MRPERREELFPVPRRTFWMRPYGDITEAARRKRLTEHDIAGIERRILMDLSDLRNFASAFLVLIGTTREIRTLNFANEH